MVTAFVFGVLFLPAMRAIGGSLWHTEANGGGDNGGVEAEFRQGEAQQSSDGSGAAAGGSGEQLVDWENAPRVDLVCRTYGGSLHIMWNTFFPGYLVRSLAVADACSTRRTSTAKVEPKLARASPIPPSAKMQKCKNAKMQTLQIATAQQKLRPHTLLKVVAVNRSCDCGIRVAALRSIVNVTRGGATLSTLCCACLRT